MPEERSGLKAIRGVRRRFGGCLPAGGCDHALELFAVEWLWQNVKTAMVENGRPKMIVGGMGSNDQLRRARQLSQIVQQILPPDAFGDHHLHPSLSRAIYRIASISSFLKFPAGAAEDVTNQPAIRRIVAQQ